MEALDPDRATYPDSDGQPMADNTLQFRWIVVLKDNLDALLSDFVAGDLLWYPVRGQPRVRMAPDVLVALGRPKGDRGSYKQWEEDDVAPAVVFEVLSPGNAPREMADKRAFYDRHGVSEYYVIEPDVEVIEVFVRGAGGLQPVAFSGRHTSALLGVTFVRRGEQLVVNRPDGTPFLTFAQLITQRDKVAKQLDAVVAECDTVAAERDAVAAERDAAVAKAERLAQRLRDLGLDPDEG